MMGAHRHGSEHMVNELKKIACPPSCGYVMQSHDENELVDMTMTHARNFHADMNYSRDDIKSLVEKV